MFLFLQYLRLLIRIMLICIWLLFITIILIILKPFNFSIYDNIPRFFHIGFLKILNIKVNLVGKIHKERPGLLISNHASWLDIPILSSLTNISFIAKSEISKWPLFGFLAKLQDTVFVERRAIKAVKQKNEINDILLTGKRLVLFPEGTSSDGNRVLKFKSSLFSVVEHSTESYLIQAVTICYKGLNGLPMSRSERPLISWWGDMDLMSHLWNILKLNSTDILVIAHEPIEEVSNRKSLAKIAWVQVSQGMGLALSGNPRSLKRKESMFF
jgi:1-acyl-sn-glycerol-3-phosphate acyltransferase